MIYDMVLTVYQRAEVLERILRVIRHRGFKVMSINMQINGNETSMVDIIIESERAITLLSQQLDKLIDGYFAKTHSDIVVSEFGTFACAGGINICICR